MKKWLPGTKGTLKLIPGISPRTERSRISWECSSKGVEAFRERHEQIFSGAYRGSTKQLDVVSLKFVRPDVAIVETLQTVTGFQKLLPGTSADAKGRLRTRLLQVLVKDGGAWKIAAYHNIDVKGGVAAPEPR